jgi:hypothetical protein
MVRMVFFAMHFHDIEKSDAGGVRKGVSDLLAMLKQRGEWDPALLSLLRDALGYKMPQAFVRDTPDARLGYKVNGVLSAGGGQTSTAARGTGKYRALLTTYYEKFNPEKLAAIDQILTVYKENEEAMIDLLVEKYGKLPRQDWSAAIEAGAKQDQLVAGGSRIGKPFPSLAPPEEDELFETTALFETADTNKVWEGVPLLAENRTLPRFIIGYGVDEKGVEEAFDFLTKNNRLAECTSSANGAAFGPTGLATLCFERREIRPKTPGVAGAEDLLGRVLRTYSAAAGKTRPSDTTLQQQVLENLFDCFDQKSGQDVGYLFLDRLWHVSDSPFGSVDLKEQALSKLLRILLTHDVKSNRSGRKCVLLLRQPMLYSSLCKHEDLVTSMARLLKIFIENDGINKVLNQKGTVLTVPRSIKGTEERGTVLLNTVRVLYMADDMASLKKAMARDSKWEQELNRYDLHHVPCTIHHTLPTAYSQHTLIHRTPTQHILQYRLRHPARHQSLARPLANTVKTNARGTGADGTTSSERSHCCTHRCDHFCPHGHYTGRVCAAGFQCASVTRHYGLCWDDLCWVWVWICTYIWI